MTGRTKLRILACTLFYGGGLIAGIGLGMLGLGGWLVVGGISLMWASLTPFRVLDKPEGDKQ